MNSFSPTKNPNAYSKTSANISNWLIYFLILIAIIISVIFYLFPFQNEFITTKKTAEVYFADNITKAHTELINAFNKKYEGKIKVIPIDLPALKFTTNKRKELITGILRSRNSRIDIFAVDQIWVPRFAKWSEPLNQYFSKHELNLILPEALTTCFVDDSLYSIPFFIDVGVLFYRTDLISKLKNSDSVIAKLKRGITWKELIDLKKDFPQNKFLYVFQGSAYEGLICNFIEVLGENASSIYNNKKYNIFNNYTIKSTQKLFDLIYKFKISPIDVTDFDEDKSFEYALKNDVPFFRGWPTTVKYSNLISKTTGKLHLLDVVPLPHEVEFHSKSTIGGWNFVLSRYSSVKNEAITFIKFVLSKESQEMNYKYGSYLPILKSFYNNELWLNKYPKLKEFKDILKNGLHRPSDNNYTKISDILSLYLNKALKQEAAIDDALKAAQEQIDVTQNSNYF